MNIIKILAIILLVFNGISISYGQIQWVTIEEASKTVQTSNKKIIIDVYTEWSGYCQKMNNTTFSDQDIINFINSNFIPVRLDGELKQSITIKNKEYTYVSNGDKGYNEFTFQILRGNLQYPSLVFLDENFNLIQPIPGYIDSEHLQMVMTYYNNNYHKKMTWEAFMKMYLEEKKKQSCDSMSN